MTRAFKSEEGKAAILGYYERLCERSGTDLQRMTVDTRAGETFLLAAGDKANPPAILLHGSSMNSAMWMQDMRAFGERFRVYAPDLPGEPGHSDERQLPFDAPDYADWLSDVMDALNIEKAALVGASLGGWLAVKFAAAHAERAEKLALLCPAGIGGQNHAFKDIALPLLMKGEAGLTELFEKINGDQPIPEIFLNYQKLIAAFFNARQEPLPIFTDDELRRLTMPCKLFVGGKDIMLRSDETASRFARLVPHGEAVVLPDKGHSLTGLAGDILRFL